MDVPDLAKTPYEMARPASDAASGTLAQEFNTDLGAALRAIVASGAASIDYVDTYGLLDTAIANPGGLRVHQCHAAGLERQFDR